MLFRMLNVYYFYVSTLQSTDAVPNMAVFFFVAPNSVLSRYGAQVMSEWFWDGSICLYYYWYHFCFYVSHALKIYYEVFIF